jgi:serine/threonine protein kinase
MSDLKPQNLLLDDDLDELVVTDFGLSRIVSHTGGLTE